jgi:hypothetical protein
VTRVRRRSFVGLGAAAAGAGLAAASGAGLGRHLEGTAAQTREELHGEKLERLFPERVRM